MGMIIQNGKQYFPVYNDSEIKALPTIDTASGDIATFDTDMTENLVECVCDIQYSQTGSGTPSPDNQRPIGVYNSLTLYHNDINIWDEQWEVGTFDNITGEKQPYANYWRSKNKIKVVPDTTYFCFSSNDIIYCYTYDINGNYIGFFRIGNNESFTTGSTVYYINIVNVTRNDKTGYPVSINYPSTDKQYHAFNGAYIPFGQTVAKGTLNVIKGELKFDKGEVTLDGTQPDSDFALSAMTGFTRINYIPYNNIGVINAVFVSNILEYVSNISQIGEGKIWSNNTASRMFLGLPDTVTNKSQMQAWFSSNPTQVVFDYANEQVIQLSPTQITALLNENNIWCDTNGDTEVKYLLTVGKKIS